MLKFIFKLFGKESLLGGETSRYLKYFSFLKLTDVPTSYTGQSGKIVKVNSTETGLEFGTSTGGGQVDTIVEGANISVDATDPANPIVSVIDVLPTETKITPTEVSENPAGIGSTPTNPYIFHGATEYLIMDGSVIGADMYVILASDIPDGIYRVYSDKNTIVNMTAFGQGNSLANNWGAGETGWEKSDTSPYGEFSVFSNGVDLRTVSNFNNGAGECTQWSGGADNNDSGTRTRYTLTSTEYNTLTGAAGIVSADGLHVHSLGTHQENLVAQADGNNLIFTTTWEIVEILFLYINRVPIFEGIDFSTTAQNQFTLNDNPPEVGAEIIIKYV